MRSIGRIGAVLAIFVLGATSSGEAFPPAIRCPSGTKARENGLADGMEKWCERQLSPKRALRHGMWFRFDDQDRRRMSVEFRDGRVAGKYTVWDDAGKAAQPCPEARIPRQGHNFATGARETWCEREIVGGFEKDGPLTTYREDGTRLSEATWEHGKQAGKRTTWYPSGQVESEQMFEDGKPSGLQREWYEDGKPRGEHSWWRGRQHGKSVRYFANGNKEWDLTFLDGDQVGTELRWYESGKKKSEGQWRDGKRHGHWKTWDEAGKLTEEEWQDGKRMF